MNRYAIFDIHAGVAPIKISTNYEKLKKRAIKLNEKEGVYRYGVGPYGGTVGKGKEIVKE